MRRRWFERRFEPGIPLDALPELLERLSGTPARLEERLAGLDRDSLGRRRGNGWSVAEHAGHLADLEPLWAGRVEDLLNGRPTLRPADLENRATRDAGHDARPIAEILADFRRRRARLVARIAALSDDERAATANHPRLEQPMTVADLCHFVAEHDDHHLATMTGLLGTAAREGTGPTGEDIVRRLDLAPHPKEGGFFRETWRSREDFEPGERFGGVRSAGTAIYYLLTPETWSEMHRLPGDEVFHFYAGDPVEMLMLHEDGRGEVVVLADDLDIGRPQHVVPGGVWQGSRLRAGGRWALLGTTMGPGFDFADYESGTDALIASHPEHRALIEALLRREGDAT